MHCLSRVASAQVAGTERRPTPPTETETPAKLGGRLAACVLPRKRVLDWPLTLLHMRSDIPGGLQKGQTTAIVTGIVSIAFGVRPLLQHRQ